MITRIIFACAFALWTGTIIAIGVANIAVVNWCVDHHGQPATPFLTTECRLPTESH